jgi:hypothetical protein
METRYLCLILANPRSDPNTLRQKGLVVMGVFSRTLMIEAFVTDLQSLVMCTANGQVTRP